ncbi:HAD family hydrolase [Streptomyces sp. NPDC060035]|uniref:HAD family hydrolase n=1 Tax=Streptomyces sp. NPDC060035 TaxID=3347044 RepID=UPI00369409C2
MVRGLILDFDGLIADSESIWHRVLSSMYALHGAVLTEESWLRGVGASLAEFDPFEELASLTGAPARRASFEAEGESMFRELMERSVPLPGVTDLLGQAAALGLRCAVASSSRRESVVPYLRQYGLLGGFDHVITRESAPRAKPAPDLYLEALSRLGLSPHEAVAFEDSPPGLQAARAAGIRCVVVPGAVTRSLDFEGYHLRLATLLGFELNGAAFLRRHA